MKTYRGQLEDTGGGNVIVQNGDEVYPLPLRLDLKNHSPTGFSWGYWGSGPSQLALALLVDHFGDDKKAIEFYQEFKRRVIGRLPKNESWEMRSIDIARDLAAMENGGIPIDRRTLRRRHKEPVDRLLWHLGLLACGRNTVNRIARVALALVLDEAEAKNINEEIERRSTSSRGQAEARKAVLEYLRVKAIRSGRDLVHHAPIMREWSEWAEGENR